MMGNRDLPRSDFTHFLKIPVRWGDMDIFGHVNNVQIMRYLESGRVSYLEDVLQTPLLKPDETVILADIQCSFIRQLHYPSNAEVATRVSRLGNSSLQLICAIYQEGIEAPVATSRCTLVWFNFVAQHSKPVPAAVREAIIRYETIPPEM